MNTTVALDKLLSLIIKCGLVIIPTPLYLVDHYLQLYLCLGSLSLQEFWCKAEAAFQYGNWKCETFSIPGSLAASVQSHSQT